MVKDSAEQVAHQNILRFPWGARFFNELVKVEGPAATSSLTSRSLANGFVPSSVPTNTKPSKSVLSRLFKIAHQPNELGQGRNIEIWPAGRLRTASASAPGAPRSAQPQMATVVNFEQTYGAYWRENEPDGPVLRKRDGHTKLPNGNYSDREKCYPGNERTLENRV